MNSLPSTQSRARFLRWYVLAGYVICGLGFIAALVLMIYLLTRPGADVPSTLVLIMFVITIPVFGFVGAWGIDNRRSWGRWMMVALHALLIFASLAQITVGQLWPVHAVNVIVNGVLIWLLLQYSAFVDPETEKE